VKKTLQQTPLSPARREPRLQYVSDLCICYDGQESETPIRPPDISVHGMFVNTSTHFPEGAVINLRFRLTQSNLEVQTRCEVRYCLPGTGIGVEFVGLEAGTAQAIEKELRAFSKLRPHKKRAKGPRQG
jgi:PilZ domain-containing protein